MIPSLPMTGRVRLTFRQWEVLELASRGYTLEQTGEALGIARPTVVCHHRDVNYAFGVKYMYQSVAAAFQQGVLSTDSLIVV